MVDRTLLRAWFAADGRARWLQPFTYEHDDETVRGENVLALLRGSQAALPVIVISAHYDHEGVKQGSLYPGADDNASGVAVLLALAGYFAAHPPRHDLLFAGFDAEAPVFRFFISVSPTTRIITVRPIRRAV